MIVIGPSNPLASIAPILAVPGIRDALCERQARRSWRSARSSAGRFSRGPTAAFMAFAELPASAAGVREYYGELLDGMVADETLEGLPALRTETRMGDAQERARLARACVEFAAGLAGFPS